jgi:hypothetical protein
LGPDGGGQRQVEAAFARLANAGTIRVRDAGQKVQDEDAPTGTKADRISPISMATQTDFAPPLPDLPKWPPR